MKKIVSDTSTYPFMNPSINAAIPINKTWNPVVALADVALIGVVRRKLIIVDPEPTPKMPWAKPAKKPAHIMNLNYLSSFNWIYC